MCQKMMHFLSWFSNNVSRGCADEWFVCVFVESVRIKTEFVWVGVPFVWVSIDVADVKQSRE